MPPLRGSYYEYFIRYRGLTPTAKTNDTRSGLRIVEDTPAYSSILQRYCLNTTMASGGRFSSSEFSKP